MESTQEFVIHADREGEIKNILLTVFNALKEKGYDPMNQMVGYILSEDPTYITNHNNARSLIRKIDRDELLRILLESYIR
jgi:uncharacterized protein (UPF0297 family)